MCMIYRRTGRAGNKGVAYTFLTIDQGAMSGDIMFALEQTNTPVPDQLKMLYDNYVAERKAVPTTSSLISTAQSRKLSHIQCVSGFRLASLCASATASSERASSSTTWKRKWRSIGRRYSGRRSVCKTPMMKTLGM